MKERIHVSSILIVLLFFIYLPPVFFKISLQNKKKIHAAAILTITYNTILYKNEHRLIYITD